MTFDLHRHRKKYCQLGGRIGDGMDSMMSRRSNRRRRVEQAATRHHLGAMARRFSLRARRVATPDTTNRMSQTALDETAALDLRARRLGHCFPPGSEPAIPILWGLYPILSTRARAQVQSAISPSGAARLMARGRERSKKYLLYKRLNHSPSHLSGLGSLVAGRVRSSISRFFWPISWVRSSLSQVRSPSSVAENATDRGGCRGIRDITDAYVARDATSDRRMSHPVRQPERKCCTRCDNPSGRAPNRAVVNSFAAVPGRAS